MSLDCSPIGPARSTTDVHSMFSSEASATSGVIPKLKCQTSHMGASPEQEASSTGLPASDLECSVCCELLVDPVVGPCGHDFCKLCYEQWQRVCSSKGPVVCPLCRQRLPPVLGVCHRLKRTIESLYPEASKRRREVQDRPIGPQQDEELKQRLHVDRLMTEVVGWYSYYPQLMSQWDMMAHLALSQPVACPPQHMLAAMSQLWQAFSMTPPSGWVCSAEQQHGSARVPAAPGSTASPIATGTPVLELVYSMTAGAPASQQQTAPGSQQQTAPATNPGASCAAGAALASTSAATSSNSTATRVPSAPLAWQSVEDVPARLDCARAIMTFIKQRGMQGAVGTRLLPVVRALELMLYRSASSKAEYMDPATLESRVISMVRQRSMAAAARRAALRRGGTPATASMTPC